MQNLKILNKKEIKEILGMIEKQWDAKLSLDYAFLKNDKGKIFIVNKDISKIDSSKLRINSIGMYFSEIRNNELRLSMEGSQIAGPKAKKKILELDEEQLKEWMLGIDLEMQGDFEGFFLIKHKEDFIGCGKWRSNKVLNYINKARRINVIS